jgi:hypothetical protein
VAGALDAGLPLPLIEPDLQISRIRLSCEHFSGAKQAEVLEILVVTHAFGSMVFALTAPVEVRDHSQPGIVPEIAERLPGIAVFELPAPPSQEGVEVLNDLRAGFEAPLRTGFIPDRLACLCQRLL